MEKEAALLWPPPPYLAKICPKLTESRLERPMIPSLFCFPFFLLIKMPEN